MTIAITRDVSRSIADCELTHLDRVPIDLDLAREQHEEYRAVLAKLGCEVVSLPEEPDLPDAVFVEDTAIVLDELAVLTRPGAASRRPELPTIAAALRPHRRVVEIPAPATLDGGDVLVVDRDVYVGLSERSDAAGVDALRALVADLGYRVRGVPIRGCLHLKSAACRVADDALLVNPEWVDPDELRDAGGTRRFVEIEASEPFAANALRVGETLVYSSLFPRTRAKLEALGFAVEALDTSELAKAEGGVTCSSLLVR